MRTATFPKARPGSGIKAGTHTRTGAGSRACARFALAITLSLLGGFACGEALDTRQLDVAQLTLGEDVYKTLCEWVASTELPQDVSGLTTRDLCLGQAPAEAAPTARLRALSANRGALVEAIDRTLPSQTRSALSEYVLALRTLYDGDDRLPRTTRVAADVLQQLLEDPELLAALERMSARGSGFRPAHLAVGVAGPLLRYERFDSLTDTLLAALGPGGSLEAPYQALLETLALELATASVAPSDEAETTLSVARALLFSTADAYASGTAVPIVLRDAEARPLPASTAPLADTLPAPLALASDIDDGTVPRDAEGRALDGQGARLYRYVDTDRTLLAGALSEFESLVEEDETLFGAVAALPLWLGPTADRLEPFGAFELRYPGADPAQSPLLDLVHALAQALAYPQIDDVLALGQTLLSDHQSTVAALVGAALSVDRVAADDTRAQLVERSMFFDDLLRWLTWVAQEPGLMEAQLRAFADPRIRYLGGTFAAAMRHRDAITYDPSDINRVMSDAKLDTPVDRDAPNGFSNQSLFQRLLALLGDANYQQICNKQGAVVLGIYPPGGFPECAFFEIDNAFLFYVEAILGEAVLEVAADPLIALLPPDGDLSLDAILENESGITGLDTTPTDLAVTRLLFTPLTPFMADLLDPVKLRWGAPAIERHPGSLFGLEREFVFPPGQPVTIKGAFLPWIEAMHAGDRRTDGRYLLGELFGLLSDHWPAPDDAPDATTQRTDPAAPFYSPQSNVVSFEPIVATAIDPLGIDLVGHIHRMMQVLQTLEVRPGVDGIQVLASLVNWLVDPALHPNLRYRNGASESLANDGVRRIPATPVYGILDALSGLDTAYASAPEAASRWKKTRGTLVDQLLEVEVGPGTDARFVNPRTTVLLGQVLGFLRERVAVHGADQAAWAAELSERLGGSLTSALGARLVDLAVAADGDPRVREEVAALLEYLVDTVQAPDARAATLVVVHDLLQLLDDARTLGPLLRGLSVALAPEARGAAAGTSATLTSQEGLGVEGLELIRAMRELDNRDVLLQTLANLVTVPEDGGRTPLEVILDVLVDVNRVDASERGPMDAADHGRVLGTTADFLRDDEHGLERLYEVVRQRQGPDQVDR